MSKKAKLVADVIGIALAAIIVGCVVGWAYINHAQIHDSIEPIPDISTHPVSEQALRTIEQELVSNSDDYEFSEAASYNLAVLREPGIRLMFARIARASNSLDVDKLVISTQTSAMTISLDADNVGVLYRELSDLAKRFGMEEMVGKMRYKKPTIERSFFSSGNPYLEVVDTGLVQTVTYGIDDEELRSIAAEFKGDAALHACMYPTQSPKMPIEMYVGASKATIVRIARRDLARHLKREVSDWRLNEVMVRGVKYDIGQVENLAEEMVYDSSQLDFGRLKDELRRVTCNTLSTDFAARREELRQRWTLGYTLWVWGCAQEAMDRAREGKKVHDMPYGPW